MTVSYPCTFNRSPLTSSTVRQPFCSLAPAGANIPNKERLQTGIIDRAVSILSHAQALTSGHLDTLKKRVGAVEQALGDVNAGKDQNLFIDFNIRPFVAPADWPFEPCASRYDTVCCNRPQTFCPSY